MGIVLKVTEGAGEGSEHPVEGEVTIGREAADLILDDEGISRTHARVSAADAVPTVEDLGSSNGTYVNGEQIAGLVELADGDVIQVGGTVLEVTGADSATQVMGAGAPPTAEHPGPSRPPPRSQPEPAPRSQPDPVPREPAPKRLAPHPAEEGNIPALAAAFLGPLSIFLVIFSTGAAFFVSLPVAIAAIVLASIGKRKVDSRETGSFRGLAVLGQVTGIIGAVLSTVALIAFFLIAALLDVAVDSLDGIVDEVQDEIEDNAGDVVEDAQDSGGVEAP